jgi:Mg/Co/Ni transporter MgtE
MGRTLLSDATDLTVADVIHKRFTALPADATVAQVRDWFATSSHRKMAFLVDQGRYAGSLTRDDLSGELDPTSSAAHVARSGPTIVPDAPAHAGYELAVATKALRVPVVNCDRALIGVLAVTDDLAGFCGTG